MECFLQFEQVSSSYPFQHINAVSQLSFSVHHGEFFGILGADDAGKTTIAKLMNGLLLPAQGQIAVGDIQLDSHFETWSPSKQRKMLFALRQRIGVIFSDPENQIVGTTVEEDVAFGLGNLQIPSYEIRSRVEKYLDRVGMRHYATRSPQELSGGEQQKLCIAGVLAMEPECLVLDEPLSFLDSTSRNELLELLGELNAAGTTIIYLTSDPEELLYAQQILILSQGTTHSQCSVDELWNTPVILENAGILPPDIMTFRARLKAYGYPISDTSFTPATLADDICAHHPRSS